MIELFGLPITWIIIYFIISLLAFTVAATLGIGGPLILLPALLLHFSSAQAVAIVVPVMFANNISRVLLFREFIQLAPALRAGATALPFALLASFFTGIVSPELIKFFIFMAIVYPLGSHYLFKFRPKVSNRGLSLWGIIIGMISGLTGTAGPPTAIAFRGYGLFLKKFVATIALLQAALQLVRFPVYYSTGLMTKEILPFTLFLALASVLAAFVGSRLLNNLNPKLFRVYLDVLLGIVALWLLYSILK